MKSLISCRIKTAGIQAEVGDITATKNMQLEIILPRGST